MPQKGHSISCQSEPHSREADWILAPAGQLQHEPTYIMRQPSAGTRRRVHAPPSCSVLEEADELVASLPVAELHFNLSCF